MSDNRILKDTQLLKAGLELVSVSEANLWTHVFALYGDSATKVKYALAALDRVVMEVTMHKEHILREAAEWKRTAPEREQRIAKNSEMARKAQSTRTTYLKTPAGRAEIDAKCAARKARADAIEVQKVAARQKRDKVFVDADQAWQRLSKLARVGEIFETVYDSVLLGGRPVGDVWYHELHNMRDASLYDAELSRQLLAHARPNAPTQVRDMVSTAVLARMVEKALQSGAGQ